jgi:hypothetical protein
VHTTFHFNSLRRKPLMVDAAMLTPKFFDTR